MQQTHHAFSHSLLPGALAKLLACNRKDWPVGYDLLAAEGPIYKFRKHYAALSVAYDQIPAKTYLGAIPRDLRQLVNLHITRASTNWLCYIHRFGQDIEGSNTLYFIEYYDTQRHNPQLVRRARWRNLVVDGVGCGKVEYFSPDTIKFQTTWPEHLGTAKPLPASANTHEYPQLSPVLVQMQRDIREFEELARRNM